MTPLNITSKLVVLATATLTSLAGCGMAETTAATAAHAEAAVETAREGEKVKAKIEQDLAAAQQQAADARAAADQ
jgi:hypothetical protein